MVTVFEAPGYSLKDTLECGQCFRFEERPDGSYAGTARGRLLSVSRDGDRILVEGEYPEEEAEGIADWFALRDDYGPVLELLSRDETLARVIRACPGIRILHQDFWEMLVTSLLTQNNNVPRIRGIVERLCRAFGEERDGALLFPSPEDLARLEPEDLACLRCGYRAPYLIDAARKVSDGLVTEEGAKSLPLEEARAMLMKIGGVGPKVADCALLFGARRPDAFPRDVWINRTMASWFPEGLPDFVLPWAGIAQQYLFHYARTKGLEL